ncbi:twin-arginine translocase TatA/TatE family subunit [Altererythrobacter fulvus]|uniref:twin-arginine translocase TatA/TatE family subunit n=1 Tax=Caenibius fulvus TaxID=2126012 RepID=UPI003016ACEA
MGSFSMVHWLIVAVVILILFGRGKISETMGDFGKGLRSFRKGMAEDDDKPASTDTKPVAQITADQADAAKTGSETGERNSSGN